MLYVVYIRSKERNVKLFHTQMIIQDWIKSATHSSRIILFMSPNRLQRNSGEDYQS